MAQIDDPKKVFNFNVIAAGLNPYAVQEVDIPDFEIDVVEHGQDNSTIKTGGKIKFGDITLEKLRPVSLGDNWVWIWINQVQNAVLGGGALPQNYKRNFDIQQLSYDNITVTDNWAISGAWPRKINGMKLSRVRSENAMESINLSIDRAVKNR